MADIVEKEDRVQKKLGSSTIAIPSAIEPIALRSRSYNIADDHKIGHQMQKTAMAMSSQQQQQPSDTDLASKIETMNLPVFTIDRRKKITGWNRRIAEATGLRGDEVLDKTIDSLLNSNDPTSVHRLQKCIQTVFEAGDTESCEFILVSKNDIHLEFQVKISAEKDVTSDEIVRAVFVTHEIRAPRAPASLPSKSSVSDAFTGRSLENSPSSETLLKDEYADFPILRLDQEGRIIYWNSEMTSLTGLSSEQHLGESFLRLLPSDDHKRTVEQILEKLQTVPYGRRKIRRCEVDILGAENSRPQHCLLTIQPSRSSSNKADTKCIVSILVTAMDDSSSSNDEHDSNARSSMSSQEGQMTDTDMVQELRHVLDQANTPIFGVDASGSVNEWNTRMAEITNYSRSEVIRKSLVETLIPPELRSPVEAIISDALKGRCLSNFEVEILTKMGERRIFLINASVRKDSNDSIYGVVFIGHDITEACMHDRAMAAMANELTQLIDTANVPIFGIDLDGDVNEWNDKISEISGFSKEEAFDSPFIETFVVSSMQESLQDTLANALDGKGSCNHDLEFQTKFNEIRHLLVNYSPRRDEKNNIVGVVGVGQDITEAVQRDRAVAGMALELRQLIDTANAPIFGIDVDGNVNEWNRRTTEVTGYTKEDAFDEHLVTTFISPPMQGRVQDILDHALQGHETSNYELEFVSKSGDPIFLLVNATTRRDPENNIVGVVGVAQDVTEDRRQAQALQEMQYIRASQEAKVETERNMTAYFAHELRNPLSAISSALQSMPDDIPESAESLVVGMQMCTEFMSAIMNNLLDVRKMEEGKMTLTRSPVSLKKVLTTVYKMLLPSVKPGVAFLKETNTMGKDWVLGDAHRMQQVMTNVVTNAIKYTVTGSVTLRIGWEGDKVLFECIDTGPGIPKSEQEKIFQRFVQRGGAPGTGLGLAIAKHLVDLAGGSIRFESDPSVRAGTSCLVHMPLRLCEAPKEVPTEESTALIEEKLSFLIIDDIRINRAMLRRRILKGIAPNAEIIEASTGEESLEICGSERFDVIVVDQYMEEAGGVMVGTDVVFAMRRMHVDSVIIGCSGNDIAQQFIEAGADWVWQKPMPSNASIIQDLRSSLGGRQRASM